MREPANARNCFVPVRVKSSVAAIRLQCAVRFSSRSLSDQRGVRRRLTNQNLEKCVTKFCDPPSQSLGCNARNAPGIVLSAASETVKSWFVAKTPYETKSVELDVAAVVKYMRINGFFFRFYICPDRRFGIEMPIPRNP